MTELKTLNDIDNIEIDERNNIYTSNYALRAEAMKWVKEIDSQNKDIFWGLRTDVDKKWIINFFNLTEEDLK